MKKIIFIFITLFIFIPNSEALSKFHLGEKVPNMHIESVKGSSVHNGIPFILRDEFNKIVYCLNPFEKINTEDYYNEYNYNNSIFNLTDEQLNKINLIAYYGYGYNDHTDLKWYGVTQFLIWKTLNLDDIYFTDTKDGNKIIAYQEEIKEIEQLVKSHTQLPSFANNKFELSINTKSEISDYNKLIDNYEIKYSNIDSYIKHNNVYISTQKEGDYEIAFIRKSPVKNDFILYGLDDSQALIYPGKVNDIEFKVDLKVSAGSITINKTDSENVDRKFAILEGAEYGIYCDDNLLTTIKTNKDGVAVLNNVSWGKTYTIKELVPSKGYKLDENIYEIPLTRYNKNFTINVKEDVIKGNLVINKFYGEDGSYELEDGAIFEIYDINDNFIGRYQTKEGIINEKLEYGTYYGIQISGKSGYKLSDKFNIVIGEEKNYIIDLYNEKQEILVVEVPNTKKYDYNKLISILLIIIGFIFVIKARKKTTI